MKVIHTKATSAPILLVSACPSMNLLAVVTPAAATVYRSTTLTVVASLALSEEGVTLPTDPTTAATDAKRGVLASWSPSGRIFTLALPAGVILLLDVEEGLLVRRLVPRDVYASKHDETVSLSSSIKRTVAAERPQADEGNALKDTSEEGDDEDEQEAARKLSCHRALRVPPSLPLSTTSGPVAALCWVSVTRAHNETASPNGADCLPLPPSVPTPLLDELLSSAAAACTPQGEGLTAAACPVAFLVVFDRTGGVSFVAGGLQEVLYRHVNGSSGGAPERTTQAPVWITGTVDECLVAAYTAAPLAPSATTTDVVSALAPSLGFSTLTARSLRALAAVVHNSGRIGSASTPSASASTTLVSGTDTFFHDALLVIRQTDSESQQLVEVGLGPILTSLAGDRVCVLCRVAEYCRTAWCALHSAADRWEQLLRGRIYAHLSLPARAALLRDAVVEAVALPDVDELEAYYGELDQAELARDGSRLALTLSVLANDVYSLCYRAYDLSLSLVSDLCAGTAGMVGTHDSGAGAKHSSGQNANDTMAAYSALAEALARRRCSCEAFLRCLRHEATETAGLLQFVMQRASLLFDPAGAAGTAGSTDAPAAAAAPVSFTTELLPAAQHPALLARLQSIMDSEDNAQSRATLLADQADLEELLRIALQRATEASGACSEKNELALPCAVVPLMTRGREDDGAAGSSAGLTDGASWHLSLAAAEASTPYASARLHALAVSGGPPTKAALLSLPASIQPSPVDAAAAAAAAAAFGTSPSAPLSKVVVLDSSALVSVNTDSGNTAAAVGERSRPGGTPRLPANPRAIWYGCLDDERHLVLFVSADAPVADGFSLAMFDKTGAMRMCGSGDDEADNEGSNCCDGDEGAEESSSQQQLQQRNEDASAPYQLAEVNGMEVDPDALMVSMSRARECCVVAAQNRFVVIDLYEE